MFEKVALLELSNSSLRMSIYKAVEGEYFVPLGQYEERIGVDEHLDIDGEQLIRTPKFRECQAIIERFKQIAEAQGVVRYMSVASQAITRAKNYHSFVSELGRTVGMAFRVMEDDEEVSALYSATTSTLDVPKGIVVNISSTSTRILNYNRRIVLDSVVLPFGTSSAPSDIAADLEKSAPFLKTLDADSVMVGIGGTFTSLGRLARKLTKYPIEIEHNYVADANAFEQVLKFLSGLDPEKRQKLRGISDSSANSILTGLTIVKAILDYSGVNKVVVSQGYRNIGLMYQMIMPSTVDRPIPDLLTHSLETIIGNAGIDGAVGTRLYDLSLVLFKQLKALHRLPRTYARILKVVSYLDGLSHVVGAGNHGRTNYALLLNLPLCGLSHREQIMAAFVASSRKWEDFQLGDWVKFQSIMQPNDLEAVKKLSNILALATAMNIRNNGIVKDITCDILGESVIIKLVADPDGKAKLDHNICALEVYCAQKLGQEFTRAFGKNLDVL